jgi:hypothetical protein
MQSLPQQLNDALLNSEMMLNTLIEHLKKKLSLNYEEKLTLVLLTRLRSEISSFRWLEGRSILVMEAGPSIPENEQPKS